jgi:hypothetical protein
MTFIPGQMPRYSECRCQSKPLVAFVTHEADEVNLFETLFLGEPETSQVALGRHPASIIIIRGHYSRSTRADSRIPSHLCPLPASQFRKFYLRK